MRYRIDEGVDASIERRGVLFLGETEKRKLAFLSCSLNLSARRTGKCTPQRGERGKTKLPSGPCRKRKKKRPSFDCKPKHSPPPSEYREPGARQPAQKGKGKTSGISGRRKKGGSNLEANHVLCR